MGLHMRNRVVITIEDRMISFDVCFAAPCSGLANKKRALGFRILLMLASASKCGEEDYIPSCKLCVATLACAVPCCSSSCGCPNTLAQNFCFLQSWGAYQMMSLQKMLVFMLACITVVHARSGPGDKIRQMLRGCSSV